LRHPDSDLIEQAKTGDTKAFTSLVNRYEDTVYRFAFKVCRNPDQAAEALQDTFINVYRKLDSFDGKSKFSTWLYTIVTNNCLMKQRRRRSQAAEESLELLDAPPVQGHGRQGRQIARWDETPADLLLDKELRGILDAAILKLPVDYRVVFVLRDVEGKSTQETAAILGISTEAAKSRLRRARAFLRQELSSYVELRR
jgi:RNA polymerase sigma-70 factor (ECF subfamily)